MFVLVPTPMNMFAKISGFEGDISHSPRAGDDSSHSAQHLLCPRSPWLEDLRKYIWGLPDTTDNHVSFPADDGIQHLSTDGSLMKDGRLETHRASWAVHSATSG